MEGGFRFIIIVQLSLFPLEYYVRKKKNEALSYNSKKNGSFYFYLNLFLSTVIIVSEF